MVFCKIWPTLLPELQVVVAPGNLVLKRFRNQKKDVEGKSSGFGVSTIVRLTKALFGYFNDIF